MITSKLVTTNCTACNIAMSRTHIVSGSGNINADIMFIGEAPGYNEDKSGKPFVGESGKLLDKVLFYAGFTRDMVYITNMIKCRPPRNRDPSARELLNCQNHLLYEINTVKPKIIVPLGRVALQNLLGAEYILRDVHNRIIIEGSYVFLPMYHPSYILRRESIKLTKEYISNFILLSDVYAKYINPLHVKNL